MGSLKLTRLVHDSGQSPGIQHETQELMLSIQAMSNREGHKRDRRVIREYAMYTEMFHAPLRTGIYDSWCSYQLSFSINPAT